MELSKTQLAIGKEKRLITMQTNGRGTKENGLSQDKLEHLYLHLKGDCVEYLESLKIEEGCFNFIGDLGKNESTEIAGRKW